MKIIYSFKVINGLDGAYRNPAFFAGIVKDADVVYTDDKDIKEAYKKAGIEVKPLKKPRGNRSNRHKEATETTEATEATEATDDL